MRNSLDQISLHVFLYYEDIGVYLLEKLAKVWRGKINLSLAKDNVANTTLLYKANELFSTVVVSYVEHPSSDQVGFIQSVKNDTEHTDYILYLHDKHLSKKEWLDAITHPLLMNLGVMEDDVGILTMEEIKRAHLMISHKDRANVVRLMQTVLWLQELQDQFATRYRGYDDNPDHLFPEFTAGTSFLIRRKVVEAVHGCIHPDFFEDYRPDGNVDHAIERFYYYVSLALGYKNLFVDNEPKQTHPS